MFSKKIIVGIASMTALLSGCSTHNTEANEGASDITDAPSYPPYAMLASIPDLNTVRALGSDPGFNSLSDENKFVITESTDKSACSIALGMSGYGGVALFQPTDSTVKARRSATYVTPDMHKKVSVTTVAYASNKDAEVAFDHLATTAVNECKTPFIVGSDEDPALADVTNVSKNGPSALGVLYRTNFQSKLPDGSTPTSQDCVREYDVVENGIVAVDVCGVERPDIVSRNIAAAIISSVYAKG